MTIYPSYWLIMEIEFGELILVEIGFVEIRLVELRLVEFQIQRSSWKIDRSSHQVIVWKM